MDKDEIYQVLEMYCKKDYVNHFLAVNFDGITHKQFIELYCICIRQDSHKISL